MLDLSVTQFVSRPWYSHADANGNEIGDVRWLRLGRGRWYVETGKWGVTARLGSIHFTLHFDPAEEDQPLGVERKPPEAVPLGLSVCRVREQRCARHGPYFSDLPHSCPECVPGAAVQGRMVALTDRPTCPDCGGEICNIRVKGEWMLGDWPPVVPVIDFDRMVVAFDGNYHKMKDGEVRPDTTSYDAFRIGAPPAPVLVQLHDCEVTMRYRGFMTEAGHRKFDAFKKREQDV